MVIFWWDRKPCKIDVFKECIVRGRPTFFEEIVENDRNCGIIKIETTEKTVVVPYL